MKQRSYGFIGNLIKTQVVDIIDMEIVRYYKHPFRIQVWDNINVVKVDIIKDQMLGLILDTDRLGLHMMRGVDLL